MLIIFARKRGARHKKCANRGSDYGDTKAPARYAEQLELLIHELTLIRVPNDDDETLPGARQRVQAIRESLRAEEASL